MRVLVLLTAFSPTFRHFPSLTRVPAAAADGGPEFRVITAVTALLEQYRSDGAIILIVTANLFSDPKPLRNVGHHCHDNTSLVSSCDDWRRGRDGGGRGGTGAG